MKSRVGTKQNPERERAGGALAYMLTFRCYGTWLHGDDRGSIDREHNAFGSPLLDPDGGREQLARDALRNAPVELGSSARHILEATIDDVCRNRGWTCHARNVRTNHVHVVVTAEVRPERAIADLKAWCTRRLREAGVLQPAERVWSYHGSTRYLWEEEDVLAARTYVVHGQGNVLP